MEKIKQIKIKNEFTAKELENEVWIDVVDYEGLYKVSDLGRVKTLNYRKSGNEQILKRSICNGYSQVRLSKNGKQKTISIHRLSIQAFCPKEFQKCINHPRYWVVDHKDNDRSNNRLNNLQVITQRENSTGKKPKFNTTSKYVGVSYVKGANKWSAIISIVGKRKVLGHFDTEIEAHHAYEKALNMYNNGDLSFLKKKPKLKRKRASKKESKKISIFKLSDWKSEKWKVTITIDGVKNNIGFYKTYKDANDIRKNAKELITTTPEIDINQLRQTIKNQLLSKHKSKLLTH